MARKIGNVNGILAFPTQALSRKLRMQNIRGLAFDLKAISFFLSQEMNNRRPQSVLSPSQIDYLIFRSSLAKQCHFDPLDSLSPRQLIE